MTSWFNTTLGEACELYQPQTISTAMLEADGPYPVYGANGVIGRYHSFNHEEPQLLITCRGATCGTVNISAPKSWINGNAMVVKPRSEAIDLKYLEHVFRGGIDLSIAITGAAQPQITRQSLAPIKVKFPPVSEQRRIAAILDQADVLRAKRREALAQLDSLTHSIFIEMFGDPATNPKGWQKVALESVSIKITDGEHQTPRRTEFGIKLLSARNVRDGYLDFGDVDYIDEAEYMRIAKRCNPQRDDILISCSGSIGRVAIVNTDEPLGMVRSAALIKPDKKKIKSRFLEAYLRTPFLNQLMIKSAHSSSQANLFQGPIRALPTLLPPLETQDAFVKQIELVDDIRCRNIESAEGMTTLFSSLQHRAFRGEL